MIIIHKLTRPDQINLLLSALRYLCVLVAQEITVVSEKVFHAFQAEEDPYSKSCFKRYIKTVMASRHQTGWSQF